MQPTIAQAEDMKTLAATKPIRNVYDAVDTTLDVTEFTMAYGCPINARHVPGSMDYAKLLELRQRLLDEEVLETNKAAARIMVAMMQNPHYEPTPEELAEVLDGLVDVVYIAVGTAVTFGWDFNEAWRRVHESNMSKLGDDGKPILADGSDPAIPKGKILKGPNFRKPDLRGLVS